MSWYLTLLIQVICLNSKVWVMKYKILLPIPKFFLDGVQKVRNKMDYLTVVWAGEEMIFEFLKLTMPH